jgi:dihydrofolate reductase
MRKIRIIEQILLDGVIQSPGGRNEDGDYAHGGWAMLFFNTAILETIVAAQGRRFDLLLGRRTYDIWAGYWPKAASSGVLMNTYRPVGLLRTEPIADASR